jgi:branched-chain amino acid transport system permease protein
MRTNWLLYPALIALSIALPLVFPDYTQQFAMLWVLMVLALTWDMQGGQMGYNSLGNIFFFGFGMYVSAIVQIGMFESVGAYTAASGTLDFQLTDRQYFIGLAVGPIVAGLVCAASAIPLGWVLFGLRGPYFAIGTLAVAVAAGEMFGTWRYVGGGQGIPMPRFPGDPDIAKFAFYLMFFVTGVACFAVIKWLYSKRFGLALNAIRDDEQKAEGMGLPTLKIKQTSWAVSAFFVGIIGAIYGNNIGFIEPLNVAFQTIYLGIYMVVAALLGGKGTLWGPIIGAVVFHAFKEVTWTLFLGWQNVVLGALIVIVIVYFQEGIVGWLVRQKPEWFGRRVETRTAVVNQAASEATAEDKHAQGATV